jgi:hypothetical protein
MKYAVEMGSGAMTYTSSFIKTSSEIQKLMGGDSQTHRQHGNRISLILFFFQNKESRLKMDISEIGWGGADWIHLAQDRSQWRALVNTVMNLPVP